MADYYGTVGAADTYHAAHGNDSWALADSDEKLSALLIASEWIDGNYANNFPGYPTAYRAQRRLWPRTSAYDVYGHLIEDTEIPVQIEEAVYEVALRQIGKPGSLFKDWIPGKDIKQVSVDGAVSVTFAGATGIRDVQTIIPIVDLILRPILAASSASSMYSGTVQRT